METSHLSPSDAGNRSRTSSTTSNKRKYENTLLQPGNPFQGLDQWDPEQDLIQLKTPRLSAYQPIAGSDGTLSGIPESLPGLQTLTAQASLLDLDDQAFTIEADAQLAGRLQEQRRSHAKSTSGSRRPSISANSVTNAEADHLDCAQCETKGPARSYCNVCTLIFCPQCWDMQIAHKRNILALGSVPHEKTEYAIAQKIKAALESSVASEDEAKLLHQKDEDTTWFGILREDIGFPSFQDYGRYANLMAESSRSLLSPYSQWNGTRDSRYPSLVSFVGQTGAGKSTIIKLVIDLHSMQQEANATPVVGSAGEDVPTSGDVHLYPDPQTFDSDKPILYADCEGLEGGEREPRANKFREREKIKKVGRIGSFEKRMQRIPHTSERDLTWANTNEKRSREFAVTHLYPLLLYTFSDVVVFVLKNPRVIESVLEKLVKWAAAALEKSSNQPVLPHAIIVLNASENDIDPNLWDVKVATEKLLQSLSETVSRNATFKKYALFWKERSRNIRTVEELLLSYYSSIRVVRVPTNGRPNLISEQISKLYDGIRIACDLAQDRRLALRMLLDANELQAYLQYAFDHFACTLDSSFDFVQASFTNSPIPLDFGGNILKLAINLMEALPNKIDGPIIFKELSTMVASCIMLDSARHRIIGKAEQIFPQYLEHIEAALENFCDHHWPCEYIKPGGGARCVNVRSGHGTKGHQLKNGKVLAVGNYLSHFSFEKYRETFYFDVYSQLTFCQETLHTMVHDSGALEADVAAEIHKNRVMKHFHNHTAKAGAESFISHSTCFSCLFESPEHALPCGHILCTACLRAYGHPVGNHVVEVDGCPIESLSKPQDQKWKVVMKPADAGIRVLTLDGGGIRGIVELEILRQIEQALGSRIAIRHFFDLVVGTSTGGIIALGLVAKNWSVEDCTSQFEGLCGRAFTRRTGSNIPMLGFLVSYYNHSKYETKPLEEALIEAYGDEEFLFGGSRSCNSGNDTNVKVAVVSTSVTNVPTVLTNYNRLCSEKLSYHFQRPEKIESELRIWEAARATSAAPKIFKPFHHEPSKQGYIDRAIYHNNPILVADKERKRLWPSLQTEYPDVMVSIGTSYGPAHPNKEFRSPPPQVGVLSRGKSLYRIATDHIASALDSEKAWHTYMSILQPPREHMSRFVRLNPQLGTDPPGLDDIDSMQDIKAIARSQMIHNEQIPRLAIQLVASSFYFEKSAAAESKPDRNSYECRGEIRCRLLPQSDEICELGKLLKTKMLPGRNHAFVIQEKYRGHDAKTIEITPDAIDRMIGQRRFRLCKITIELSSKLAETEIYLSIKPGELYMISRFPRSLLEDEGVSESMRVDESRLTIRYLVIANTFFHVETRQITNSTSRRWAGRTPSRKIRREQWTPPDLNQRPQRALSTYSEDGYVLGDSSPCALKRIAILFRNGPNQRKHVRDTTTEPAEPAELAESAEPEAPSEMDSWLPTEGGLAELDSTALYEFTGQDLCDSPRAQSPPDTPGPVELDADP